jgi:leucyl aminopeptidase
LFSEGKEKIHAFKEREPVPAKPSEQNILEKESETTAGKSLEVQVPAPTAKQKERRLSVGAAAMDELKTEVLSRAPKEKASAEKKEEKISLTVCVKDIESAGKEIENVVIQLRGEIIKTESLEGKKVITAECDSKKINELIERLRLVGEVKEKGMSLKTLEGIISIRIEIMSILTQPGQDYS